ncbi:hypothetical protein [Rhizobium leguminosarum]|uniref:Uncharacterized protein n=1 Tax=Rhizobium leguminosarum TaxID=384 RepID=A0A2K9ZF07_RHILE|nr:hypothetical protein [Rhizobium leguminosarum]AUW46847.1 hypothetical protein CUJ84_pRLN2000307 [Rhizobium leguminosarum]
MKTIWKVLFWIVIIGLGLPVLGILVTLVLSSFTDFGSGGSVQTQATLDGSPSSTSPPDDLSDALSFFSKLTEVQKDSVKDKYRGMLVEWTLPVWDVTKDGEKYIVQTSSDAPISIFCKVSAETAGAINRLETLAAGNPVTCKGLITGYTLGFVNISPAVLTE